MRSRTPKVLHAVCGRPMIDWVIDAVRDAGVDKIRVVINPHHAEVAAHLAEKKIDATYQRDPRGTAHALQQVEGLDGVVLVVNGDSPLLTGETVRRVLDAHRGGKGNATLASVVDPSRDDGRIVRGPDGEFEKIVERKDASDELRKSVHEFNVGVYCFDGARLQEALARISDNNKANEYYLTDVFLHLRPVTIVQLSDPAEAMGIKDRIRLAAATGIMQRRILDRLMERGVTIVDPDTTFIEAGVAIGQDTTIEPFSVIKGTTEIGSDCHIGPHVHIEDATIGDRSDCGPFVKIRNFDGERKNRTEIGDGAFVGVDTMLVAPVKLGRGARTGAGSVVTKDVPDGATAVGVPARVIRRKKLPLPEGERARERGSEQKE